MNPGLIPLVLLNNGLKLPFIGLGTYEGPNLSGEMNKVIEAAIDAGYRFFDCALMYQNEIEIGEGICSKIMGKSVQRGELKISTKLWNTYHDPYMVRDAFEISREYLNLEYVDMYLMHWPMAYRGCFGMEPKRRTGKVLYNDVPFTITWKAMEKLVDDGSTLCLGLSNFNIKQIKRLLMKCRYRPVVNQIECHPYLPNTELKEFSESMGMIVIAYCPLGCRNRPLESGEPILLEDMIIKEIASRYGKTAAQILLRWAIQRGTIPIPKTINTERLTENISVFDFCLCREDMEMIDSIKQKVRYCHLKWVLDHPDYPFSDEL